MSVVAQYPLGAEVFVTTDVYINDVLADPSNLTYQILGPDEELLVYVWETDAEVVRLLYTSGKRTQRWFVWVRASSSLPSMAIRWGAGTTAPSPLGLRAEARWRASSLSKSLTLTSLLAPVKAVWYDWAIPCRVENSTS